jgi:hypothetical protein
MAAPLWLQQLRSFFTRPTTTRPHAAHHVRLRLEILEDRTVPSSITVLASDLHTAGGLPEAVRVVETGTEANGNDFTFEASPGVTYNFGPYDGPGVYGSFTVASDGSISSTSGAAVAATENTIDFDRTKLAAVTIYGTDLKTAAGVQQGVNVHNIVALVPGPATDTLYLPAGTFPVATYDGPGVYGYVTVADDGSGSLAVTGTSGAAVATGNTIHFDLTELAAVTIDGTDIKTAAGAQQGVNVHNVAPLWPGAGNDTLYLPAGTFPVATYDGPGVYGYVTVSDDGSGSLAVTGTSGAAEATGNTIHFDLTKLAAVTIYGTDLKTAAGARQDVNVHNVAPLWPTVSGGTDTLYLPAGTFPIGVYDGPGVYGYVTVSDDGSGSLAVTGTSGAAVATGNTIHFNTCALNNVRFTPNPGVTWYINNVSNLSSAPDTVRLPDGTYTISFLGATGGVGTETFTVDPNGLSDTQLPETAPLVSLQLVPCAPSSLSGTVTLGNLSQTYSGSPESATATTNAPGISSFTFTYNGSTTAPTAAGSYTVVATLLNANYQGSATGTLVIAKATLPVVVNNDLMLVNTYYGGNNNCGQYNGPTATGGIVGQTSATLSNVCFSDSYGGDYSHYTVTAASWGDNCTNATGLTITGSGGNYLVNGSHLYAQAGTYSFCIHVKDSWGHTCVITGSTTVCDQYGNAPGTPALTGAVNTSPFTNITTFTTAQGDILTIGLSSTVRANSPVGTYPIVATVIGAASANYIQPTSANMYVVTIGHDSGTGARGVSFWDNSSNAKLITATDLSNLDNLDLVNNNGSNFNPTVASQLQTFLRNDTNGTVATFLSAQLASMDLNVLAGNVQTSAEVYAGNLLQYSGTSYSTSGLDTGGFITVGDLMTLANNALALYQQQGDGYWACGSFQGYMLALADALQAANNNTSFAS